MNFWLITLFFFNLLKNGDIKVIYQIEKIVNEICMFCLNTWIVQIKLHGLEHKKSFKFIVILFEFFQVPTWQ